MQDNFGYSFVSKGSQGDASMDEGDLTEPLTPAASRSSIGSAPKRHSGGPRSGSETEGGNPMPPVTTNAVRFKPRLDHKRWTRTGLSQEYQPTCDKTDSEYGFPFPRCSYQPRQKLNLVCSHIRHHLNIAIECHYCPKAYWSSDGWEKHCQNQHGNLPQVQETATKPETFENPLGENLEIEDIKAEEEDAIKQALQALASQDLSVEPAFVEVLVEDSSSSMAPVSTTTSTMTSSAGHMDHQANCTQWQKDQIKKTHKLLACVSRMSLS